MTPSTSTSSFDPSSRAAAVIGGGTLGARIALMLASGGGEVRLFDAKPGQAATAQAYVEAQLPGLVATRSGARSGRFVAAESLPEAVDGAWLVVESVPERLDVKKKVFGDLDAHAPVDAILASNSSSYPSSQFIDLVSHPERVLNTHFFMPPEQNGVELMSCGRTDAAIIDRLMERLPLYGLVPFHVLKESVGFIFNRIWAAIKRESLYVVAEGVSTPQEIDRMFEVLLGLHGFPFALMDKVGLDVVLDIEEHYAALREGLPTAPRELLKRYIDSGRLGVKSGKGFYEGYASKATGS